MGSEDHDRERVRDIVERLTAEDILTSIISSVWCKTGRHPGELADLMKEAAEEITRLRAENEKLQSLISAVDKGAPVYKAVERILDEKSAWIARPNHEVTEAVALSAGIAWAIHFPNDVASDNFRLRDANEKLREALIALAKHCNNMEAQNHDYHAMGEGGAPCISEPLANAYSIIENTCDKSSN